MPPTLTFPRPTGKVYLVGAGPGDPDLLTVKALRVLRHADVVLHDRLVSDEILALIGPATERVFVGKSSGHHSVPQEEISHRLVRLALQGRTVCRLKGGDPFVFGRGGEELTALATAGIAYEVVPGVTAAVGCGAYAGIPLTHRDHAQSVTFVTGHRKRDQSLDLNWAALAGTGQTVVFYMGLQNLPRIVEELLRHGASGTLPIALVANGTMLAQQTLVSRLGDVLGDAREFVETGPTLIIVGEVVGLREQLAWFGGAFPEILQDCSEVATGGGRR